MEEEQYNKLNEIDQTTPDWKARVIVIVKKQFRIASNANKTKYQNLILADEWGNYVDAVMYGSDIESYNDIIHQDRTYVIKNAVIQRANYRYRSAFAETSNAEYSWTINATTDVKPVARPKIVKNPYKGTFSNYDDFKMSSTISTILVITKVIPPRPTRNGHVTDYICLDKNFKEVTFCLWEDNITDITRSVLFEETPIVVLINFLVHNYKGLSLCPSTTSLIVTRMDHPAITEMQKWRTEHMEKIQEKITKKGGSSTEETYFERQELSISELLNAKENRKYIITVQAKLEVIQSTCMYVCCENCFRKTASKVRQRFMCDHSKCNDYKFATWRYRLFTQLKDLSGHIDVTAFGRFGEMIMHLNEYEFHREFSQDWNMPKDDINSYLEGIVWKVTVQKKKYESNSGSKMSYSIEDMSRIDEDVADNNNLQPHAVSISELTQSNSPGKYALTVEANLEEVPPCFMYVCCETCFCRTDVQFGKRFYCPSKTCSDYKNNIRRYRFCIQVCNSSGEKLVVKLYGNLGSLILNKNEDEFHEEYFPNWEVPLDSINKRLKGIKWKIIVIKKAFKLHGYVVDHMAQIDGSCPDSGKLQSTTNMNSSNSKNEDSKQLNEEDGDKDGKSCVESDGQQNTIKQPAESMNCVESDGQQNTIKQHAENIIDVEMENEVIHHIMGNLTPDDKPPKCAQLYFYGTDNEVNNRIETYWGLQEEVIRKLMSIIKCNPYEQFFRSLKQETNLDERIIVLKADPKVDKNIYNLPVTDHVAAIWEQPEEGDEGNTRDIRVYTKSGKDHYINYYYGCYDPLQYPLLFPYGEPGWQVGIKRLESGGSRGANGQRIYCIRQVNTSATSHGSGESLLEDERENIQKNSRKKKNVSVREYYCYMFQIRRSDKTNILRTGRIIQQFIIDSYIKLETQRLDFIRLNQQQQIRVESLQGIKDSVASDDVISTDDIGRRIYLPSSHQGSPRDMHNRYMNALALVQRYGKPDFFITMTCNTKWKEIQDELLPGEEAQNRPDLLTRVFHAKNMRLKEELIQKKVLGDVVAYFYVIEFQKRGLPHAHWLLILDKKHTLTSPEAYDTFVSAEIPDQQTQPHLYSCVKNHMMHGPCGQLNKKNVCMVGETEATKKCKNKFPKQFCDTTAHKPNSYPNYMRRNNGRKVYTRNHQLDNRWVVSYNPYLLAKFDCHMNVEICSGIKLVKYLYKYVCKGTDKVKYSIEQPSEDGTIDEIEKYQDARWVCAPESMWRLYGFNMNEMHPPVNELGLHLENKQKIYMRVGSDVNEVISNPLKLQTQLTEFFTLNRDDPAVRAKNLLYREFIEFYKWDNKLKTWLERQPTGKKTIGRLEPVRITDGPKYHLRVLLNNVRAPTSYEHLRTVDNVTYDTFNEAALKRGLLESDKDLRETLKEACGYKMPYSLRGMFATILYYNCPSNPSALWEEFKEEMAYDFLNSPNNTEEHAYNKTLKSIDLFLQNYNRSINDYRLVQHEIHGTHEERNSRNYMSEIEIQVKEGDLNARKLLNDDQKKAFNEITSAVQGKQGGAFFLDGPGGTGKTFLYRALLAHIRSQNHIALAVATSGVAASLLPGGRTAHNRFGFPNEIGEMVSSSISKQSGDALLIKESKLIIWDEATMAHRKLIEGLDNLLQDLTGKHELFGGKTVVFGGDFRQTVPIVKTGGRQETVDACLVRSYVWPQLRKLRLTRNMRAKEDPQFMEFLMRIGDGKQPTERGNKVNLPEHMCMKYAGNEKPLEHLIAQIYPSFDAFSTDPFSVMDRAILAPRNDCVDEINESLINTFPGKMFEYFSINRTEDPSQQVHYEDFLNDTNIAGFPQHHIKLKKNCPIMLMRNLNAAEGLCNGTRMVVNELGEKVIGATIAAGEYRGKYVIIPRIKLEPRDLIKCPIPFKRKQFPIKLCFAMTINKAQGQTLDRVGIYLPQPIFSHGQLYVALSRARKSSDVKVLIKPPTVDSDEYTKTRNIVYEEILHNEGEQEMEMD